VRIATDRPQAPTAIRTNLGAIFLSMELSRTTWLLTSLSPGDGERMSKHAVRSGDVAGLLARFSQLRDKVRLRTGQVVPIIVMQEAGLDGFWIHRLLAGPIAQRDANVSSVCGKQFARLSGLGKA
jgi:transposase